MPFQYHKIWTIWSPMYCWTVILLISQKKWEIKVEFCLPTAFNSIGLNWEHKMAQLYRCRPMFRYRNINIELTNISSSSRFKVLQNKYRVGLKMLWFVAYYYTDKGSSPIFVRKKQQKSGTHKAWESLYAKETTARQVSYLWSDLDLDLDLCNIISSLSAVTSKSVQYQWSYD